MKEEKKKFKYDFCIISLCFIGMLSNSAYALIAPFLPLELAREGVPMELFGYIFSMYSLAVIICSPLIGYFLTRFKRRNFIQFGLFTMSLAMFGFAYAKDIGRSYGGFLSVAFISRFIQGFSSSAI
jgi:MFS family permease